MLAGGWLVQGGIEYLPLKFGLYLLPGILGFLLVCPIHALSKDGK